MKYGALESHKRWRSFPSADSSRKSPLIITKQWQPTSHLNRFPYLAPLHRTVVQNVNSGNPPSRHRQALLTINFLPWRLPHSQMTPVGSHSVLLDCDGVAGSSSSPCLDMWNSFRQMFTRILWAPVNLSPPLDCSGSSAHILGSAYPWHVSILDDTRTAPLSPWTNISCKCTPHSLIGTS